ncbi:hypothetical protein [Schlesneria sp. T3-172]|uniref:hypothetical protein n=2 Tax=Schlesneria TaxID=656899 RepID=UPI0037C81484
MKLFNRFPAIIHHDDSTTAPSLARKWETILFSTVLIWTFLGLCFPMYDTDFWWHLKTGQSILAGNGIPGLDLYTFTDADKPWIDLHWGFQVLVAILYAIGGVPLVTLVKAGVVTAAVAIGWRACGNELPAWKKSLLWIFPIICIAGRGNERPEMLSQLFLAMWLWIAWRSEKQPDWMWWLPVLQIIWVNCHALFVLGLIVGFSYAVDAVIRSRWGGRFGLEPRTDGPPLGAVFVVAVLVALACLINPYFEEGALFPLTLYRKFSVEKEFYRQNIGEFRPPIDFVMQFGLSNLFVISELIVWLVTAASFVWLLVKKGRWSPYRLILFAGYSHLAWQASRNTNIFALVSAVIACQNFAAAEVISSLSVAGSTAGDRAHPTGKRVKLAQGMTGLFVILTGLVVSGVWNQIGEKNKPFGLGEAPNWFIHDAAKFAGRDGFPMRAFVAHIGQAEVYVYHNGPLRKVFMDARLEVCTQQTFQLYNGILAAMAAGDPIWQNLFREGEPPVVILDSRSSRPAINGMLQNPTWRLVFADKTAAVFLHIDTATRLSLPPVDPSPLMYPDGEPKEKSRGK